MNFPDALPLLERQFHRMPGMVSWDEYRNLFELCCKIDRGSKVVEIGTYLGKSTSSILLANLIAKRENVVFTYDRYESPSSDFFSNILRSDLKRFGVLHLLTEKDGVLDFLPSFEHFISELNYTGHAQHNKCDISELPEISDVALLHLDFAKDWESISIVLLKIGIKQQLNGIIIFQDFFYHHSATQIAGVYHLMVNGYFDAFYFCESSLYVSIRCKLSENTIQQISDRITSDPSFVIESLKNCFAYFSDRRVQAVFLNRIILSAVQYAFQMKHFKTARDLLTYFCDSRAKFNDASLNDFLELVARGFQV